MMEYTELACIALLIFFSVVTIVIQFWPDIRPSSPESGERGILRKEALSEHQFLRRVEPVILVLSNMISKVPLPGLQLRAKVLTEKAGYPIGIGADDLLSLSVICSFLGSILFSFLAIKFEREIQVGIVVGLIFGAVAPWFKLQDIAKHRVIAITRGLPGVVDLISLSMESGLDFVRAVEQTAKRLSRNNPLRFELELILHKLSLGSSRADVLLSLAQRIPVPSIQQFTASVIQAEKRGTPLAEVLATQARVQRIKRSQAAEQAAARAAVFLIGPLMMIFLCVMIIIMGPFAVKFIRGDMF